jgi:hypothetical protein
MRIWIRVPATVLVVALLASPLRAQAIDATDAWRALAMQVKPGTQLDVRLHNGQRFPAVLVATRDEGVVILPKARLAVPAQFVAYSEIVSLERRDGHGMSAGKAVAIGVGAGGAAFLGILLMLAAAWD